MYLPLHLTYINYDILVHSCNTPRSQTFKLAFDMNGRNVVNMEFLTDSRTVSRLNLPNKK